MNKTRKGSFKSFKPKQKGGYLKLVPDTSVIIEGLLSKKIEKKELAPHEIIVHEAVMAELESQANKNRETGYLGLEEIKKLRELGAKRSFRIVFKGHRPNDFEIKYAKSGEIDSLIRKLASEEKATLVTADKVQSMVAESKGIAVILYEFELEEKPFVLEKYFDEITMSVHIKEDCTIKAKKGKPGGWQYLEISPDVLDREAVKELAKTITEETSSRTDGFIEADRKGSTIIQLANYRIVITRPPFADGYEITAVRPIKKLALEEYKLNEKILKRIEAKAEGILIAGAPGHGKTTFAQALAEHYLKQKKVIKTIESPRDLTLSNEVTQYSMNYGSSQEIHDILLLSRPDYTIFDEMRNTEDFRLYSDLRLSGVGMIGVLHATKPIDAIQRFIGRIELGVIPHVIDTVIFITNGEIDRIFSLGMEVKVPSGMTEADLARPVVVVNDFNTGKLEFEIYSYGEETVVIPVMAEHRTSTHKLAEESIKREITRHASKADVEIISGNKCKVIVPKGEKGRIIGRQGENINSIEKRLGMSIDVVEEEEKKPGKREERTTILPYELRIDKKNVLFMLGHEYAFKEVDVYVNDEFVFSATASKKAMLKINKHSPMGRELLKSTQAGENVEIRG
ncbi:Flp pilus assembly complex ATPase component TadA [Candidatus Woesearchaeota archaeon]|nr:Flp pilus assembly complex ATPase component TadA [Candidatus Woesearchaeota archaeon]